MRKLWVVAYYTAIESIRNKVFYITLLFALIVISSSIVFSQISGEVAGRVIVDVGLGAIELFALLIAIFGVVRLIIQEIENRTISVVLSKPIKRSTYLLGKYIGMSGIIFLNILIMFSGLVLLLLVKGEEIVLNSLVLAVSFVFLKMLLIMAIGLFFSLFSTSSVSTIAVTFMIWVLGHFSNEIKFLSEGMTMFLSKFLMKGLYYILPNFQYFNFRDFLECSFLFSGINIFLVIVYAVTYSAILIGFSIFLFSRREV